MITIERLYQHFLSHPVINTDSRRIIPGCIFFALRGENFNGNRFVAEALERGASLAVVDENIHLDTARVLRVDDTLKALQQLAVIHRSKIKANIIAITGSNGKTTTKELFYSVLSSTFPTQATFGNLNNHIGVPLTILTLKPDTVFAVIEMGANHPGEIASLCQIARPNFGVITNIGKAHLEGFGGLEGVIKAKTELYKFLKDNDGLAFVNSDNPLLVKQAKGISKYTYGSGEKADCQVAMVDQNPYLKIKWQQGSTEEVIQTGIYGTYNLENITASIAVGTYFNVTSHNIITSISSYSPKNNRSQHLFTENNNTLILDAYNANPTSMKMALQDFSALQGKNKLVILGDMLEMGSFSLDEHQSIIILLKSLGMERVILIGKFFSAVVSPDQWHRFPDTGTLKEWLKRNRIKDSTILIKGSRKIGLENITGLL